MAIRLIGRGHRAKTRGSHTGMFRCLQRTEEEAEELVG